MPPPLRRAWSFGAAFSGNPWGFGWAAKGFDASDGKRASAVPASLHIQPWKQEPDTRSGEKPTGLQGTLTATGLTTGASYDVYRALS